MEKTAEQIEADRAAVQEATRVAAETETARLAAEAEEAAKAGKTPEQIAEEESAAAEAAKGKPEAKADWRDDRIAKLAADKAKLAAELAKFQKAPPGEAKEPPAGLTEEEVDRRANERAQAIADRAAFNSACNEAAKAGRKDFPDFDASVKALTTVVDRTDAAELARYDEFLASALETGEAPKIIYTLGRDPGEYLRIMELSPVKRAQELALLAGADAKQVSGLPKPITPLSGQKAGGSEISPDDPTKADKLSSAEWHKRRNAQLEKEPLDRRRRG